MNTSSSKMNRTSVCVSLSSSLGATPALLPSPYEPEAAAATMAVATPASASMSTSWYLQRQGSCCAAPKGNVKRGAHDEKKRRLIKL